MKHRNTGYVVHEAAAQYRAAIDSDLMQVTIRGRRDKSVTMPNGRDVVEFINCSYLGLDVHPDVVDAYQSLDRQWGVNFCCARSRFSIEPLKRLEEELSLLYLGRAITFPSVTTAHLSVMPLVASGVLIDPENPPKVRLLFDRFAHSSMQFLKPILGEEAAIDTIAHNDMEQLRLHVLYAKARGETPVYVADGLYSMGGLCPIRKVLDLAEELDFYVYIDDAHGTTIFGERGEGPVLEQIAGPLPERMFLSFSLTKGFGVEGGGILLADRRREEIVRTYGQVYAFSAPLDFAAVNACLKVIDLHRDGTVRRLQDDLRDRVALFDSLMGIHDPFSPIRMVMIGDEQEAIRKAQALVDRGFFASVVFFPIVPRGKAQLRLCLSANHSRAQVVELVEAIRQITQMPTQMPLRRASGA